MIKKTSTAFTLVELSIVLLIIGLIIGGITAGSSLIQQAKLKAVISEIKQHQSEYNIFKVQFNYRAGDMPNAFQFWGATCGTNDIGLATSCNGNADGVVFNGAEANHAWIHLDLAGITPGNYIAAASLTASQTIGVTVPASKYGNSSGYIIRNIGYYNSNFNAALEFGNCTQTPFCNVNLYSSTEAYNVDSKIDDGLAGQGKFQTVGQVTGACTDQVWNSTTPGNYVLSGSNATIANCSSSLNLD
jgi:hypothetical protein